MRSKTDIQFEILMILNDNNYSKFQSLLDIRLKIYEITSIKSYFTERLSSNTKSMPKIPLKHLV
jgi:hypothetical protein